MNERRPLKLTEKSDPSKYKMDNDSYLPVISLAGILRPFATHSAPVGALANILPRVTVLRLHAYKPGHLNDNTDSMVGTPPYEYL